ncbi:hypothetical protein ABFA07_016190 [Porites harrisoni]
MERKQLLGLVLLATFLQTPTGAPLDENEKNFALKFLKEYHYLSPLKDGNQNLKDALRLFQQQSEIPETGHLDPATIKEMHKPRCGVPDLDEEENSESGRVKRFSISGDKWKKKNLTYSFHNYASNGVLNSTQQRKIVRKAFTQWEEIGPLSFVDVTDNASLSNSSDITLSFFTLQHSPCSHDFDGENGVLAHAFFPESGHVHFDDDETFTDGVSTGKNLFSVALHEIGHLLGLKHSAKSDAIMHATYKPYKPNMNLTDDETHGINFIYVTSGNAAPNTTSEPSSCINTHASCNDYADYCEDADVGSAMRNNCPVTCGICGSQGVASSCEDDWPQSYCSYYQQNGYCIYNITRTVCQKTCNVCSAG